MTISTVLSRISYTGNGMTTAFAFPYLFFQNSDLKVYQNGALKLLNTDYTVTGANAPGGGTVTFTVAPLLNDAIIIFRDPPFIQSRHLVPNDPLDVVGLEQSLDLLTMETQRLSDRLTQGLSVADGVAAVGALNADAAARANQFLAFDSLGNLVVNLGTGTDNTLRTNLAASSGSSLVGFLQAGTGAAPITLQAKGRQSVSVTEFYANGVSGPLVDPTGVIDSTLGIQAALDSGAKDVWFGYGRFKLSARLVPHNGQRLLGIGPSAWSPYGSANTPMTELLVTNFTGIDMTNLNNVECNGISVRSINGGTSTYGAAANYGVGSIGFLLTGTTSCRVRNAGMFGLEYGWAISPDAIGTAVGDCELNSFTASDCKSCVRVGSSASTSYHTADIRISDCIVALHCNKIIEIHYSDGVRIDDSRFFQAHENGIYIRKSPYVEICGVTQFETLDDGVVLTGCDNVTISSLLVSKSGGYISTTPWPAKRGLVIDTCTNVSIQGSIERPGGRAANIINSNVVKLDLAVIQPFYTNTQNTADGSNGAVDVATSTSVNLDIALSSVANNCIYAVSSDFASYDEIDGSATTDAYTGLARTFNIGKSSMTVRNVLAADTGLNVGSSSAFEIRRIWVPANKSLVSRSLHMTSPNVTLRVGALFWTGGLITEADGGYTSFEKKTLFTQGGTGGYYQFTMEIYNTSAGIITVPAGHRSLVSFGIE